MKTALKFTCAIAIMFGLMSFATTTVTTKMASSAVSQAHKWEKLGSRVVNLRGDHDEIPVTAMDGFFSKVKFVVRGADIFVHNVKIVFGNGESKNIPVNKVITQGTHSRVIDLPGNKRIIRKVVMNYKRIPNFKGKAIVNVWGKH
jgi:hypothetical protein